MNYTPIESLLSSWPHARAVVTAMIPPKLTLELQDDTVNLDLRFLPIINDLVYHHCPQSEVDAFRARVVVAYRSLKVSLPKPSVWAASGAFGRADQARIALLESVLDNHYVMRESMGRPSFLQVVRHLLGIAPSPYPIDATELAA